MNMKKNIIYSVLTVLAALGFASCSSESETEPVASPDEVLTPITISANYGGNSTRVAYAEDGNSIDAKWEAGDQLYVCYDGHVNTLTLVDGAGTATATFSGTIQGTPSASSVLICYVRDKNNPAAITVNNGENTYASGTFTTQDGTLAGAAKCNVYYGATTYGTGENISCTFSVNTSMMKFMVTAPNGVSAGDAATLSYKSGDTELAKASFTVGANGKNTIYMTIPAGQYSGAQTLTYNDQSKTLSATKATFTAGATYHRYLYYGTPVATPLTVEALTDGTVQVSMRKTHTMNYSVNGKPKTEINSTTNIPVNAGDKVHFYGSGTATQVYGGAGADVQILGSDGLTCKVYGNIMSLLDEENFDTKTNLPAELWVFNYLFDGNTTLTDASELLLPATTLNESCYAYMFRNCTALTAAPALPATTLAQECYFRMFQGCTALTTAPALPATTLINSCYGHMFEDCTNLNSVTCLATSGFETEWCLSSWLKGVASTGTVYCAKGMKATWEGKSDCIPTGWTVVEVE